MCVTSLDPSEATADNADCDPGTGTMEGTGLFNTVTVNDGDTLTVDTACTELPYPGYQCDEDDRRRTDAGYSHSE